MYSLKKQHNLKINIDKTINILLKEDSYIHGFIQMIGSRFGDVKLDYEENSNMILNKNVKESKKYYSHIAIFLH